MKIYLFLLFNLFLNTTTFAQMSGSYSHYDNTSENINLILMSLVGGIIISIVIYYITISIIDIIKTKNLHKNIINIIKIDVESIRKSEKIKSYKENVMVIDIFSSINHLENLILKPKPLNIKKLKLRNKELSIVHQELIANYNNVCSLIDTKNRMGNDIDSMRKHLIPWKDHQEVFSFITSLDLAKAGLIISSGLIYQYDSIKTKFNSLDKDLKLRNDIENIEIDFSEYLKNGEKASIVAKDLNINYNYSKYHIAVKLNEKLKIVKEAGVYKYWKESKDLWNAIQINLKDFKIRTDEVFEIEKNYKKSLIDIPLYIDKIESCIKLVSISIELDDVRNYTKESYKTFVTKWNNFDKNVKGSVNDVIKLSSVLESLLKSIETILKNSNNQNKKKDDNYKLYKEVDMVNDIYRKFDQTLY